MIWILCAVTFLANVSVGARMLIIPLYGSHLGLSAATIGLLYAVFAALSCVISFPAGMLLDRHGTRRLLAVALAMMAVSQILTVAAMVPALVVSQMLSGAAFTVNQISIVTAASGGASPRQMGRAIGLTALAGQTGLMAGPAIAGTMLGWVGFTNLIIITTLPALVGLGLTLTKVRDVKQQSGPISDSPRTRDLLKNLGIRQIAILAVAMGILWGTFQAYFAIFASKGLQMHAASIGWLIAIGALSNAASRIPASGLMTRFSRKEAIIAASVFGFAVSIALLPHFGRFWSIAILLALTIPLVSLAVMGMSIALAELGGPQGRGRAISVMYFLWNLASAAAPAALAPAMDNSFAMGFAAASLASIATAGAAMLMRTQRATPAIPLQ
jgi:MFS family permease